MNLSRATFSNYSSVINELKIAQLRKNFPPSSLPINIVPNKSDSSESSASESSETDTQVVIVKPLSYWKRLKRWLWLTS